MFAAHLSGKIQHNTDCLLIGLKLEYLGADVEVHPDKLERRHRRGERLLNLVPGEAKLAIDNPGG